MLPSFFIGFLLGGSIIWSSGEKKQTSLTEWCETVKIPGEEEEGTSVLSRGLPGDSTVLDREDASLNCPVGEQDAAPPCALEGNNNNKQTTDVSDQVFKQTTPFHAALCYT